MTRKSSWKPRRMVAGLLGPFVLLAVYLVPANAYPRPGITERVSVASDGTPANEQSDAPAVSADGRYVAFQSDATNLVPGDTNGPGFAGRDVFVYDRATGTTERVSVASDGAEANSNSSLPAISPDGRYVGFYSGASNLVPGDTNGRLDVFVHDRATGTTERVSVASDGAEANSNSNSPAISADGRHVAFLSTASNLVPGDTSAFGQDVFVHDRATGTTERVNVASDGTQADAESFYFAISADGRHVAFSSGASNLVPGDTNATHDIFVHDRSTGVTERVSVANDGDEVVGDSYDPALSADGRHVAFSSDAVNLVPTDSNGRTDIFVRDRQAGTTERVSVASDGDEASAFSDVPAISADGRQVAFFSPASNLVPGDTNARADVFVHDRATGVTERVNVASDGAQANDYSDVPAISADGRYVAFKSNAFNLVPGDAADTMDVFVHERGGSLGVVGRPSVQKLPGGVAVSGRATFSGTTFAEAADPDDDGAAAGPVGAADVGAELIGATMIYRPEEEDLLLRLDVSSLPSDPTSTGIPGVLYGADFQVEETRYEVRALRVGATAAPPRAPYVALYLCDPQCTEHASLTGSFGTTGEQVRVSVPLSALGAAEGSELTDIRAFTAVGEATPGGLLALDEVAMSSSVIPASRVELGIAKASIPADAVAFNVAADLATGDFSGTVPIAGLSPGNHRVWARACLGDACGPAAFTESPITGPGESPTPTPTAHPSESPTPIPTASPTDPAEVGEIRTVAGNGNCGNGGGDGGPGPLAQICFPYGLSAAPDGGAYIADSGNNRIRRLAPDGTITTVAGTGTFGYTGDGGPATQARLRQPGDVVPDGHGNVYIADSLNNRVRKVDANGTITTVAGTGARGFIGDFGPATQAQLSDPWGLALDDAGNLYIAEWGGNRVRVVDTQGIIRTLAGIGAAVSSGDGGPAVLAGVSGPRGVAVGPDGSVYITETGSLNEIAFVTGGLASSGGHRVRKVDPDGTITTVAGTGVLGFSGDGGPATEAQLYEPLGVALNDAGELFITDYQNHRIRKVGLDGVITTVVGSGTNGFAGDGGPALQAALSWPTRAVPDGRGNLYVADFSNNRIRKVFGVNAGGPEPTPTPTPTSTTTPTPTPSPTDDDGRGSYPQTPNDPYFGLNPAGPTDFRPTQWALRKVQAPQAWQEPRATGHGIRVAVLDTGVDLQHEDLQCAGKLDVGAGSDVVANDSNPDDEQGHGTHVAGIIGACTNNGTGVAGVAPDTTIVPIRVLNAAGSGTDAQLIAGLDKATELGVHVVNMSLGYVPGKEIINDVSAIDAAIGRARDAGVVLVAAAGNDSFPLCEYPALAEDVICVGATDPRDQKAAYSVFPNKTDSEDTIGPGLVAPGGSGAPFCDTYAENVLSTIPLEFDTNGCTDVQGYANNFGTSMASPHVAGVAALVYDRVGGSRSPDNAQAVVDAILTSVDDLGTPGYDPVFGFGRVNALKAVQAVTPEPDPTPTPTPSQSPTTDPSQSPTTDPSQSPTTDPSESPTTDPSESPTTDPSESPTTDPSESPTTDPSESPTTDPGPTVPAAPSNLTAGAASSSRIELAWTDNSTTETGFAIERSLDGANWQEIATAGRNATMHLDMGLNADTSYFYRVRALNPSGYSPYSNIASATTMPEQSPDSGTIQAPAAPSNLSAGPSSPSRIELSWNDNSTNEDGFALERSVDGATWQEISSTGRNQTTYLDSGLAADTTYHYRIRAYNSAGHSAYSPTASATTHKPPGGNEPSPTASDPPVGPAVMGTATTSIASSHTKTSFNNGFELSGVVERDDNCTGPLEVAVSRRIHGTDSYESVASTAVNGAGAWGLQIVGRSNASYIAQVKETATCQGDPSAPTDVLVKAKIARLQVPASCRGVVRGRVRPNYEGTTVTLQRRTRRGWRKIDTDLLNAKSRFTLRGKKCGVHRVVWSQDGAANEPAKLRFRL